MSPRFCFIFTTTVILILCYYSPTCADNEKLCTEPDFDLEHVKLNDTPNLVDTKLYKNSGIATPVVKDLHSYLVTFLERSNNSLDRDLTLQDFICSGTILNRKWILSKAIPLAYYSVNDYFIVIQSEILFENFNGLARFEADYAAVHPEFTSTQSAKDLLLVRTAEYLKLSPHIATVPFPSPSSTPDVCSLIVWTLAPSDKSIIDLKKLKLVRAKIGVKIDKVSEGMIFLTFEDPKTPSYDPSYVNLGAPLLCDSGIFGVFKGDGLVAISLREDSSNSTFQWLRTVLSVDPYEPGDVNVRGRMDLYEKFEY